MKVEHVLNMSAGLVAAWRRSKLQHCLDKSASYQVQHRINITSPSRPSSVSLRWGFGTGDQTSTLARAPRARAEADVDTDFDVSSNALEAQS